MDMNRTFCLALSAIAMTLALIAIFADMTERATAFAVFSCYFRIAANDTEMP